MENFEMVDVESVTNIERFGYQDKGKLLLIIMMNGGEYLYKDVPRDMFERMKEAASVGSFIHRNLKGRYRYEVIR